MYIHNTNVLFSVNTMHILNSPCITVNMKNYWTLDSNNRLIHFHIQKKTWFVRSKLTLTVVFTLFGTCLGEILSSDPEFQTTRGLFLTPADHLCVPSLQSLICAPSRLSGRQRRWSHRQPAEKWIGCLP